MGNREALLAGARRCLFDKGYARTTARDVATTAGVSLAAIGYHFGSKEALLNEALQQAIMDWGDDLARLITTSTDVEAAWAAVLDSFATSGRLWAVQFELLAHLEHHPELRKTFTEATREARLGLAQLFHDVHPATAEADPEKIGAFYQTLLAGLAAQWLADPDSTPSSADLFAAMRAISAR